jgi:uncharacterized membrane protein
MHLFIPEWTTISAEANMHLPSRGSMIVLMFFVVACYVIFWWVAGFYTPEKATFRDWSELIAAIAIVMCVLGYFIVKRLSHASLDHKQT